MTTTELYSLLEDFQTTLVGIVGFVGVIWTLRSNSKNAKEEHERQITTKRRSLRRILAAELRNYHDALLMNSEADRPSDEVVSVGRIHRLFSEQLSSELGLLDLDEIDIVMNALITLDGMEHLFENLSVEVYETRFLLPTARWEEIQAIHLEAAAALHEAIDTLQKSGEA